MIKHVILPQIIYEFRCRRVLLGKAIAGIQAVSSPRDSDSSPHLVGRSWN
jgi:hypothetical protein